MSAPMRGLLFRQARLAVDEAATYREAEHRPVVLDAAAQLLASWWTQGSGYGIAPSLPALAELPGVALDALAAVDAQRQPVTT